jgi:hypothetical protein
MSSRIPNPPDPRYCELCGEEMGQQIEQLMGGRDHGVVKHLWHCGCDVGFDPYRDSQAFVAYNTPRGWFEDLDEAVANSGCSAPEQLAAITTGE